MLAAATAMVLVLACSTDETVTGPSPAHGIVHGSVTSAKTSEGIADLVIVLEQGGHLVRATPTDATGHFEFDGLAIGDYVVRATGLDLAGMNARYTALSPAEQPVTVGAEPVPVFIAAVGLIPPRIVGVVRCAGVPVEGARVRVVGGASDSVFVANAQGKYGATDLDAGRYAVIVESAPCAIEPAYRTATLLAGQAVEVDFDG
jgi:Carboxypeptidase regulatory-like domain